MPEQVKSETKNGLCLPVNMYMQVYWVYVLRSCSSIPFPTLSLLFTLTFFLYVCQILLPDLSIVTYSYFTFYSFHRGSPPFLPEVLSFLSYHGNSRDSQVPISPSISHCCHRAKSCTLTLVLNDHSIPLTLQLSDSQHSPFCLKLLNSSVQDPEPPPQNKNCTESNQRWIYPSTWWQKAHF